MRARMPARKTLHVPGVQLSVRIRRYRTVSCVVRHRYFFFFFISHNRIGWYLYIYNTCVCVCVSRRSSRGAAVIGQWPDNCYLTDHTILEMDPNRHFVRDAECDIFNRGSYGRGCELDTGPFADRPWPPAPGRDLTPAVHTTYRPQYGVPPPLPPSQSGYGPKYGPPASPPLQFFPVTPSGPPPSPSPPPSQYFPVVRPTLVTPSQYFPVTPSTFVSSTKRTGIYVPSLPPTTFYQTPVEYTPAGVEPSNRSPAPGGFDDLFDPYGQNPTRVPTLYGPYQPPTKCKTSVVP